MDGALDGTPYDPSELETKLSSRMSLLQIRKERNRKKSVGFLIVFFIGFALVWLVAPPYREGLSLYLLIPLGLAAFVLALVAAFPFAGGPLDPALEKVYHALELVRKSRNDPSVRSDVYGLVKSSVNDVSQYLQPSRTSPFLVNEDNLLRETLEKLKHRLLPAASNSPIRPQTLEMLARVLLAPSLEALRGFNLELNNYEPESAEPSLLRRRFLTPWRSWPGQIVGSLLLGYLITGLVSLAYAVAFRTDFVAFARENPAIVLMGGPVVAGLVLSSLKYGKR